MTRRICIILVLFLAITLVPRVFASELDDINNQINEIRALLEKSKNSSQPLEETLRRVEKDFVAIENNISIVERDIETKQKEIADGEKKLGEEKGVFDIRLRSYYKNSRHFMGNSVGYFLSNNVAEAVRKYFYQQRIVQKDRDAILKTAFFIAKLEEKRNSLQQEKITLSEVQKKLDEQKKFYEIEVGKAKNYQSGLEKQIVELTVKQQQLIASRISGLNLSRSAGSALECVDDRGLDPRFGQGFAFYTYGIPHRVGMSQYGAYGRASVGGQDYKTILNAYFQNMTIECRDIPGEIQVDGFGGKPFEEYIKGVVNKEMGADILEALKSQAIAARSFALALTNNASSSICATERCQVYSDARRSMVNDAVDATGVNMCGGGKAEVMTSGGQPIKAWYASTFGGYAHTSAEVWGGNTSWTKNFADTSSGVGSFSELNERAYDKESKCFYTAQGSRGEYGKSAWLKPSEVADIVNTLLLLQHNPGATSNLYQLDKSNPDGTDNWSAEKVRSELQKYETPFNTISSVSVNADFGGGRTNSITFSGDAGTKTFSGDEFKARFNLRAPSNISIVGPLYNIEKR